MPSSKRKRVQGIMSILRSFADMMQDVQPASWWDHVILVFTCVDYTPIPKPQMAVKKHHIIHTLTREIKDTFNLAKAPPAVFISSKMPHCAFILGNGPCDCLAASRYNHDKMRNLRRAVASKAKLGRWVPT
ncbi:hypothetical protein BCR43DRAFT_29528 [Syncephalastrum racemosum]|uniref:Uncharacterized protein n=1 Tax=Syncephalastrum racemosum TaxID=13706 RepID=A0A1X2HTS5_SYNRA|nr:hypothetical protein BCR43DRAFT_29528 [Syncephalastrum racemosum]